MYSINYWTSRVDLFPGVFVVLIRKMIWFIILLFLDCIFSSWASVVTHCLPTVTLPKAECVSARSLIHTFPPREPMGKHFACPLTLSNVYLHFGFLFLPWMPHFHSPHIMDSYCNMFDCDSFKWDILICLPAFERIDIRVAFLKHCSRMAASLWCVAWLFVRIAHAF